jgi:CRP-like cAMP-binding protein
MTEYQPIVNYVLRYVQLSQEEINYFISLLRITKVKKRQQIVQPEFTCKYRSYVIDGAMRAYFIDKKAQDHTIAFAVEDWWISDFNSYIFQQPARLFVEALEDTTLIQIDYNSEQLLMETIPQFERFFRIITQRAFAFLQQRTLSTLSMTAEERYEEFLLKYPSIANRVPQYTLASYLGMSTEYLSKLRNQRVSTKS